MYNKNPRVNLRHETNIALNSSNHFAKSSMVQSHVFIILTLGSLSNHGSDAEDAFDSKVDFYCTFSFSIDIGAILWLMYEKRWHLYNFQIES